MGLTTPAISVYIEVSSRPTEHSWCSVSPNPARSFKWKQERGRRINSVCCRECTPRAIPIREIEEASAQNEEIVVLRKCVQTNDWTVGEPAFKAVRNELTVLGKLVLRGTRLVIPKLLRKLILDLAHQDRPSKDSVARYGGRYRRSSRTEVHNMSWFPACW